jgi:hypothetical protein
VIPNHISAWVHKKLLRFYPQEFREEFGTEMEQDFRTRLGGSKRSALPGVWLRTFADWLISMPREQLDVTRRDLHVSLRALARSPLFTLVVVLSLAVGIAAPAVVFTFANSLLIQTPLEDPSRFVGVLRGDGAAEPSSWLDYVDYRDRNQSFSQFAAWNIMPVFLGRGQRSQSVMAETDGQLLRSAACQAVSRPAVHNRRLPIDVRSTGDPQPSVLAAHPRWRPRYSGPTSAVERRPGDGYRHHARGL